MPIINPAERQLKHLYQASSTSVEEVTVPSLKVLTLEGRGSPGSPHHIEAASTLMAVAHALKPIIENQGNREYAVMPLEGLWWTGDGSDWQQAGDDNRFWKLLVVQPEDVSGEMVEKAMNIVAQRNPSPLVSAVRLESLHEGKAAQLLHIGPYANEARSVAKILGWIRKRGAKNIGTHHEIYLDDPTRTPPDQLRTILRYPYS